MNLYKAIITPKSSFLTTLKGDTLFGQICWAVRYIFGENRLNELLCDYDTKPFLVVSDGFVSGYLPKPHLPLSMLNEPNFDENKKQIRKKIWLNLTDLQNGNFKNAKTQSEVFGDKFTASQLVTKNSLNRKTFTTDDSGEFAPFVLEEFEIPEKMDIYLLLDESKFGRDDLEQTLKFVGCMGYGKKSTIGKGRFEICKFSDVLDLQNGSKTFMTLSPVVLNCNEVKNAKECFYEPFTRFGKHGGELANTNPFKKPILMADCGAVVVYDSKQKIEFIGRGVREISSHKNSVAQGYAIVLPLNLGVENGTI